MMCANRQWLQGHYDDLAEQWIDVGGFEIAVPTHWMEILPPTGTRSDEAAKPLSGRWHHGGGHLCCGTIRVAKEDFDTNPSNEFKTELFDWMCQSLNSASRPDPVPKLVEALTKIRDHHSFKSYSTCIEEMRAIARAALAATEMEER